MIDRPKYPPSMLTTGELARYRADLEHRLAQPLSDDRKQDLQTELDAVVAEQTQREKTTGLVPTAWTDAG